MLSSVRGLSIALLLMACVTSLGSAASGQEREAIRPATGAESLANRHGSGVRQRAELAYASAQAADRELRFGDAARLYEEASTADSSAPFAPLARNRMRWIELRSEGEYEPLTRVERMRRDVSQLSNPDSISALDRDADRFAPGQMRAEAWLLVADARLRLLHQPVQAMGAWNRVLEDPNSATTQRVIALGGLVDQFQAAGDNASAVHAVRRWGDVAPGLRAKVLRLQRRGWLNLGAFVVVVVVVGAAIAALVRLARKGGKTAVLEAFPPHAAILGGYVAIGGATLTWAHAGGGVLPFVVLGIGVSLLVCAGRAWRCAWSSGRARFAAVGLGLLGVLAVAWIALRTSPPLTEGFGL
jgi:hypothetical protein